MSCFQRLFKTSIVGVLLAGTLASPLPRDGVCAEWREPRGVKRVEIYDCRNGREQLTGTIDDREKIEALDGVLSLYKQGWKPVRGTVAVGKLRLDFLSQHGQAHAQQPLFQVRVTSKEIQTYIGGKPYSRGISPSDQRTMCDILGLEKAYFSGDEKGHR